MTDTQNTSTSSTRSSGGMWISVCSLLIGVSGLAAGGFALEKLSRLETGISLQQQEATSSSEQNQKLLFSLKEQSADITEHKAALQSLRSDLAALHENIAESEHAAIDEKTVEAQIKKIAKKSASKDYSDMLERIASLEAKATLTPGADQAHESAFSTADIRSLRYLLLREVIAQGKPHEDALIQFKETLGDGISEQKKVRKALENLESEQKIRTAPALYAMLTDVSHDTASQEKPYIPNSASKSWLEQSEESLTSLVKIERVDAAQPPHQRLEKAFALARMGDVVGAAHEIAVLPEADKAPFEEWLSQVEIYESAHDALDVLRTAASVRDASEPETPKE